MARLSEQGRLLLRRRGVLRLSDKLRQVGAVAQPRSESFRSWLIVVERTGIASAPYHLSAQTAEDKIKRCVAPLYLCDKNDGYPSLRMTVYRRILCFSLCSLALFAQREGLFAQSGIPIGQYTESMAHFNPAAMGLQDELHLSAIHNRQLEGLDGSSKSFVLLGDIPVPLPWGRHSAGMEMSNESFGLFRDTELVGRYAIRIALGRSFLQVGLGASIISSTFEGSKVYIPSGVDGLSPTDPALPAGDVSGRGFDAHAGLYYHHPKFWVGASATRLFATEIMLDQRYHRDFRRAYIFSAGYRYQPRSRIFRASPSVLALWEESGFYRVDCRLDSWWYDKFRLGMLYRHRAAVGVTLGINLGKAYLGYQYELPTTELRSASWGNHELLLSYAMPVDLGGKKKATYKSVRLL